MDFFYQSINQSINEMFNVAQKLQYPASLVYLAMPVSRNKVSPYKVRCLLKQSLPADFVTKSPGEISFRGTGNEKCNEKKN